MDPNRLSTGFESSAKAPAAACQGKPQGGEVLEAFDLLRTYLDTQIGDLKSKITHTASLSKPKENVTFASLAHKHQFEFNSEIKAGLENVASRASEGLFVKQTALDLIKTVNHRNKLIKLRTNHLGAGKRLGSTKCLLLEVIAMMRKS